MRIKEKKKQEIKRDREETEVPTGSGGASASNAVPRGDGDGDSKSGRPGDPDLSSEMGAANAAKAGGDTVIKTVASLHVKYGQELKMWPPLPERDQEAHSEMLSRTFVAGGTAYVVEHGYFAMYASATV